LFFYSFFFLSLPSPARFRPAMALLNPNQPPPLASPTPSLLSPKLAPKKTAVSCSHQHDPSSSPATIKATTRPRPGYIPNRISNPKYISIFDTTLCDDEQSPGASLTPRRRSTSPGNSPSSVSTSLRTASPPPPRVTSRPIRMPSSYRDCE